MQGWYFLRTDFHKDTIWTACVGATWWYNSSNKQDDKRWQTVARYYTLMTSLHIFFHHNACLTLWRNLMGYFVPCPNGEVSFNKFLSPDPDHLRGGPSHGYNTSCKNQLSWSNGF